MTSTNNLPPVGSQLYTVRAELSRDFAGTLRRVADIGYTGVETAFFDEGVSIDEVSRRLRALGLTVFSAHVDLPLGAHRDDALRTAETFGCRRIVWHGWPEDVRYSSLDGIRQLADEYNAANEVAAANGLQLGLHNHWWEMTPVEGQLPYRVLRERIDPRIFFELDVYWAMVAGLDPVAVIQELGERAPLLHIKDGPAVRNQPMTAVGSGSLDIPAIAAAARGTAEWLVVELDECATDMLQAIEESYLYLTTNGLGR
jgi:sugar phosphate isomerase/epimerase